MGVSKTSDPIQIKIKMLHPSQEPPASSKAPNQDLKDMDVLCTFKIKIESQNSEYGCTKDQWPFPNQYQDAKPQSGTSSILQSPKWWLKGHGCALHLQNQVRELKFRSWMYERPVTISISRSRCQTPVRNLQCPPYPQIMGVLNTRDHIQIKIQIPNHTQEPPASCKAQNQDLKDTNILCTFKIKIEGQDLEHGCTKDQWPYPNQDQDAKPQSGNSSILRICKWGLKGHGCSLYLQNLVREPKFGSWIYQRPVTISKSRSRCQNWVRNLPHPPKPQMRT